MAEEHDQILRELIAAFPADFVELILPDVASRIDFAALDFRKEEYFTDSPRGGRPRRPDLVAWVPTLTTTDEVGIHVEIEARYRSARVAKLFDYNRLLSLRRSRPVHTLVVYCRGGPPGVRQCEHRVESLGQTLTVFYYGSLGLSGASAPEYLARQQPLAWALAALMRPAKIGSRAKLRVACLRRIVAARHLEEERRFLLFNFVATYIESDQGISEEYDELFRHEDNREVREEMMTWAEKIEAKGYTLGRQQGLEHGRREGEATLLLRMAERKFGQISPEARQQIETARTEQLLAWGERLVTAESIEETLQES